MELLNKICIILFCILFFSWTFTELIKIIFTNRLNAKELYKNIKDNCKKKKVPKYLFRIVIINIILFSIYLVIGIVLVFLIFFMSLITLGGAAYIDAGSGGTFYEKLISFVYGYFNIFKYICYYIYLNIYMILIRLIYINILSHKMLKDRNNLYKYTNIEQPSINKKTNTKKSRLNLLSGLLIAIVICILPTSYIINNIINNKSIDLDDVAFPIMNTSTTMTPNWYFFHDDKLYVYDYNGVDGDQLYYSNLYANNKEVLISSEDLRFANIFMVYNDEMFYYTRYNRGIKKVNLKTGQIKNVIDNQYLYLMQDTLKDGKVLVNYQNNYTNNAHTFFAILDLRTGVISNEKKVKYATKQPYFYNKDTGKIYYIDSSNEKNNIYEDNRIIYTYEADNNLLGWKSNPNSNISDIVFIQDNYIFAIVANKIIKFDLSSYEILEEKRLEKSFLLLSSVRRGESRALGIEEGPAMTSLYPLFSIVDKTDNNSNKSNGSIYKFNSKTLCFEKIIEKSGGGFLQRYGDYFILQSDNETVIYNDKNGKYKIYNSANYSVENDHIYLMTYSGDFYRQKKDNLKFKIKKIFFEDIF